MSSCSLVKFGTPGNETDMVENPDRTKKAALNSCDTRFFKPTVLNLRPKYYFSDAIQIRFIQLTTRSEGCCFSLSLLLARLQQQRCLHLSVRSASLKTDAWLPTTIARACQLQTRNQPRKIFCSWIFLPFLCFCFCTEHWLNVQ